MSAVKPGERQKETKMEDDEKTNVWWMKTDEEMRFILDLENKHDKNTVGTVRRTGRVSRLVERGTEHRRV